jgi:hypothetical protein
MIEQLEARRLMAVTVVDRVVHIDGTSARDEVSWGGATHGPLQVFFNGAKTLIPLTDFDSVYMDLGAGERLGSLNRRMAAGGDCPGRVRA